MTHILLTGAGFTRNWGGWLAKELEGDLLARLAPYSQLRHLLQHSDNYEDALGKARGEGYSDVTVSPDHLRIFESAISESFWVMNAALGKRVSMYFAGETDNSIETFLPKFDAIFTLNQDLLLEFHYSASQQSSRWIGSYYPGIDPPISTSFNRGEIVRVQRRVASIEQFDPHHQPIYKLHGSIEWTDGSDSLFVVGGGKEAYIKKRPLLVRYFEIFKEYLAQKNARLMIIGYGFADDHINKLIETASHTNPSLGVYYVHPEGRDAINRGMKPIFPILTPLVHVPCIGESRRALSTTFGGDTLEYDKLMRFFK